MRGTSVSRFTPQREHSRYTASTVQAKNSAWRYTPCRLGNARELRDFFVSCSRRAVPCLDTLRAGHVLKERYSYLFAASGGFVMCFDWPARPALTEIRLLIPAG